MNDFVLVQICPLYQGNPLFQGPLCQGLTVLLRKEPLDSELFTIPKNFLKAGLTVPHVIRCKAECHIFTERLNTYLHENILFENLLIHYFMVNDFLNSHCL